MLSAAVLIGIKESWLSPLFDQTAQIIWTFNLLHTTGKISGKQIGDT